MTQDITSFILHFCLEERYVFFPERQSHRHIYLLLPKYLHNTYAVILGVNNDVSQTCCRACYRQQHEQPSQENVKVDNQGIHVCPVHLQINTRLQQVVEPH